MPADTRRPNQMDLSKARVAVLAENQYQELELWYPVLRFREEESDVVVIAPSANAVYSSKLGYPVVADYAIEEVDAADYDAVIVPGGFAPEGIRRNPAMLEFIRAIDARDGIVATICHAGWVLASTGIAKGKRATCVPIVKDDVIHAGINYVDEAVVRDGNLITSRLPSDLPAFIAVIKAALLEAQPRPTAAGTERRLGGKNATPEYVLRARLVPVARGSGSPDYATAAMIDA
jgi:protease I